MKLTEPSLPQDQLSADAVDHLCANVVRRFDRAYPIPLAIVRLDGKRDTIQLDDAEVPRVHVTCQECHHKLDCEREWEATLQSAAEPRLKSCAAENFVAFVPVLHNGRPVAAFQLVESPRIPRSAFQHRIELIVRLIEESESGTKPDSETVRRRKSSASVGPWWHPSPAGKHPQIERAIDYIDQHLADPRTNVASVARALGVNATYLSHIFSEGMGTRMSRYIASRRVQLAKKLLATTDWQVKRVAFESGHSNADWFSQVFHSYTGLTPCAYRRRMQADPSEVG